MARRPRVLLCASGSVATVKVPEIAVRLTESADVCIVLTKSADFFLQRAKDYNAEAWKAFHEISRLPDGRISVVRDEDEWQAWNVVGDSVRHIEVRRMRRR
jgi:phosphopantothenoylcysteine decarboxylase